MSPPGLCCGAGAAQVVSPYRPCAGGTPLSLDIGALSPRARCDLLGIVFRLFSSSFCLVFMPIMPDGVSVEDRALDQTFLSNSSVSSPLTAPFDCRHRVTLAASVTGASRPAPRPPGDGGRRAPGPGRAGGRGRVGVSLGQGATYRPGQ